MPVPAPAAPAAPEEPEPALKHVVNEQSPVVPEEVNVAPVQAVNQLAPDVQPAQPVQESLETAASSWGK